MRRAATTALAIAVGLAVPRPAVAAPTCTTVSVVMLPGYTCQLGALLFDFSGTYGFQAVASTTGNAGYSGPASYDLVFDWVGNQVTVTYQPVGGAALNAWAVADASHPDGGYASYLPTAHFEVTVDPANSNAWLLGVSGQFGSGSTTVSGPGYSYGMSPYQFLSVGYGSYGFGYGHQFTQNNSGAVVIYQYGGNSNGANLSNVPLRTGNILAHAYGSGTALAIVTYNQVEALANLGVGSGRDASANASVAAAWSTTFTFSVVPEPATVTLLATGFLGLGGVQLLRRRRWRDQRPGGAVGLRSPGRSSAAGSRAAGRTR